MAQVTGRAFIAINGKRVRSKPGARLSLGGERATAVVSDPYDGSHNGIRNEFRTNEYRQANPSGVDFTYEYVPPTLEFKISDVPDIDIDDLRNLRGATIVFETDTGRTFTIMYACLSDTPTLTPSSGEWELKFVARECV